MKTLVLDHTVFVIIVHKTITMNANSWLITIHSYYYCFIHIVNKSFSLLRDLLKNLNTLKNLPFVNSQYKIFNNFPLCKSSQLDNFRVLNTLWLIFLCIITWWFQSFVKMYIAKLGCLYLLCNWLKFSLLTLRSRVRIQQGLLFLLWISIHFKKLIFPQNLNLLFVISSWIHAWNPYL